MRELDPTDAALERSLRALRPAPAQLDRDRLMFEAGARSGAATRAAGGWLRSPLWPGLSAAFAALALTLAVALVHRPAPSERQVIAQAESPTPPSPDSRVTQPEPIPEPSARATQTPPWATALLAGRPSIGSEFGLASYRELRVQITARGADALPSTELGLPPLPRAGADDPLLLTLGRRLLPGRDRLRAQTQPEGELQ